MAATTPSRRNLDETWFKARWAEYSRQRRLRGEPLATVTIGIDQLRRDALEFFSWGCVHQAIAQQRLEELLPEETSH